ncbi:MAG: Rrf2 family transcriptional regulator [Candidatus Obscuribacter phosphatis]|uniref:Rrf2 family transcriptional regulator n=1 Tax=Candidatus Obscuribacter phosphatis TaxID=1906157 RepID=A0A8J7PFD5_9BACT|nr:Rrf2 family transcriptional regulator [Candidatus Obscuribacter phosphatis]
MVRDNRTYTSDELAKMLDTNPVLVRRTMAALRDQGYVRSERGHGGGWQLSCDLEKVSLLDIYLAIDKPTMFNIGASERGSDCQIEKIVNESISEALDEAENLILKRFGEVRLAMLNSELDKLEPKASLKKHKH